MRTGSAGRAGRPRGPAAAIAPLALAALLAGLACAGAPARTEPAPAERPIPWPVEPPPEFQRAIERGTRTARGEPGPAYWVQWADYTLTARVDPAARRLEGEGRIVYHNRSPDALGRLELQLIQNLHAPGSVRSEPVEVTEGVELSRVTLDGGDVPLVSGPVTTAPRARVSGTRLTIVPAESIPPGATATLELAWSFAIPQQGAGARMGWSRDDFLFLAYWYPQMAVYDDVVGWQTDPFTGNAEFYADHGSYDVTVEAPPGWLVRATGEQTNPEATLHQRARDLLRVAMRRDTIVRVASASSPATLLAPGPLRWRFVADSVRDVAFSVTRDANWDATRTPVGDRDGDGVVEHARIEAVWRDSAPRWARAAEYARHAIRFLSEFTATPYPWPHMTAVEGGGIIGGGMEYPMMTLIGDYNARGDSALYYVTAHELAHMWVPMIVSNDERRAAWMDEGTTSFHENQARKDFFPGLDHDLPDQSEYLETARTGHEGEVLRWSDFHESPRAYSTASYPKPATLLAALRAILGEETFFRAWHAFFDRWAYRHPYPWDLWNTFEDAAGRDLDWFWRPWYLETWTMDQAVAGVRLEEGRSVVVVEDRGLAPVPVHLTVQTAGAVGVAAASRTLVVGPETWLAGRRRLEVPVEGRVVRVEIDAALDFPDIDRSNNVWPRE